MDRKGSLAGFLLQLFFRLLVIRKINNEWASSLNVEPVLTRPQELRAAVLGATTTVSSAASWAACSGTAIAASPALFLGALALALFPASFGGGNAAALDTYQRPLPFNSAEASAPLFPPRGVTDGDALSSLRLYVSNTHCLRVPCGLYAPPERTGGEFAVAVEIWTLGEAGRITAGNGRAE